MAKCSWWAHNIGSARHDAGLEVQLLEEDAVVPGGGGVEAGADHGDGQRGREQPRGAWGDLGLLGDADGLPEGECAVSGGGSSKRSH